LTSSLQSFSPFVLNWQNFENLDNIWHHWAKKGIAGGIEHVRGAQSSRKMKEKARFFLNKNGLEKILEQSAVKRD